MTCGQAIILRSSGDGAKNSHTVRILSNSLMLYRCFLHFISFMLQDGGMEWSVIWSPVMEMSIIVVVTIVVRNLDRCAI